MLTGLIALASEVVPTIAGWIGGDDAESKVKAITDAAKSLTGTDDEDAAEKALRANPELLYKFKTSVLQAESEKYQEDTKRLQTVNATMQAEISGTGIFKTGWRPFFGWTLSVTFAVVMFSLMFMLGYTIVYKPENTTSVISSLGQIVNALFPLFSVALSVLGVAVWKRSTDKAVAATGTIGTNPITSLVSNLKNKKTQEGK